MITLYEPNEIDFTHNGIGILDKNIYDAAVEENLNGLFMFTFSYPLFAPYGTKIDGMSIIKVPTPDGDQLFRVVSPKPSMGELVVQCYHIFYDLTENLIEDIFPESTDGNGAMHRISEGCQYKHPFTFYSDIPKISSSRIVRKNPVEAILDSGQDNSFINRWGGELKRDNFDVKMLNNRGKDRGVVIQHKKNLLGYEGVVDWKSPITRIMPQGFDGLFLPEKYVDSPLINKYPHPKIRIVEFKHIKAAIGDNTDDEDAVPLEEAYKLLREAAKEMFAVQKVGQPKATYKVEFQELSQTEEYKDFAVLQRVYMGDTVTVEHEEDNLHIQAKVIAYKYDPIKKEYTNLTIGNFKNSFTDVNGKIDKIQDELADMPGSILDAAKNHATSLINSGFGGHVRVHPDRILIMDTKNEMTAQKVWQWNINGLGYSSTGINGTYETAITRDGRIVADFITTGTLNASLIVSGSIKSRNGRMGINLDNAAVEFYSLTGSPASTVSQAIGPDGREITYWTIERIRNPKASLSIGVRESNGSVGNNIFVDGESGNVAINAPFFESHAYGKFFGWCDFARPINFTPSSYVNSQIQGTSWTIDNIGGHQGAIFAPKKSGTGSLGTTTWTWAEMWVSKWNGVAFSDFTNRGVFEARVKVVDGAFDSVRNTMDRVNKESVDRDNAIRKDLDRVNDESIGRDNTISRNLDTFAEEARRRLSALESKVK
ncbi:phage tail spike protein [Bacillus wiedmannii]|uniref:Phage endopeptidase n=1 Tax=Bacillus wiedmannii TaxID=1890302 RepID=A0A1C4B5U7_9BACI|nr:phage tail spike protein [Bacillus wiedmannii]SCC02217.1 Phage endopeptidase [Bacillus wiedmannii]